MGEATKIQWADHTFNPWIGCSKVHAGCTHCYAEADFDKRRGKAKWGEQGTRVVTSEANWKQPLTWNRAAEKAGVRRRVFCASLADVFEDWQGPLINARGQAVMAHSDGCICPADMRGERAATMDDVRRALFALIDATPWLDWMLLTKRPENIGRMWPEVAGVPYTPEAGRMNDWSLNRRENVWLGTSVSDQETADRMVPELLDAGRRLSPVLFISAEPLLNRLDLVLHAIDWLIVGGESGPKARRCNVAWVRSLVRQCRHAQVPCFVKQLGTQIVDRNDAGFDAEWHDGQGWPSAVEVVEHHIDGYRTEFQGAPVLVRTPDRKGGNPDEWPADLRVRQFPRASS